MEMKEIIKGMSDGAEAIEQNFGIVRSEFATKDDLEMKADKNELEQVIVKDYKGTRQHIKEGQYLPNFMLEYDVIDFVVRGQHTMRLEVSHLNNFEIGSNYQFVQLYSYGTNVQYQYGQFIKDTKGFKASPIKIQVINRKDTIADASLMYDRLVLTKRKPAPISYPSINDDEKYIV